MQKLQEIKCTEIKRKNILCDKLYQPNMLPRLRMQYVCTEMKYS